MTQDEIIEMARDSGMDLYGLGKDRYRFVHHLEAFAKLVAAKEREACAKLCDAEQKKNEDKGQWMWEAKTCGIAIRARGEE